MILVTGASGHIGSRVAQLLAERECSFRMMSRTPADVADPEAGPIVKGDYAIPETLPPAFEGVTVAFLVSGYAEPGRRAEQHKNAIDAAVQAGTEHIVYLSFQGAAPDSAFPMSRDHYETEEALRESSLSFTALRDNLYVDLLPELFGPDGVIRGPADGGRVAWVSREDVARTVVGAVLRPQDHAGIHNVTGPESLTLSETASRVGALVNRELQYENETVEEGRAWRRQMDVPEWEVETWLGSYRAIAEGELATPSDTVRRITGRPPLRLEEYFSAHPELLEPIGSREQGDA